MGSSPRSGRSAGFTLLEVLVAVVLLGVVAMLVYGTASVSLDTERRLVERRRALQSSRAWRATIEDALRNAYPAPMRGDTTFLLESEYTAGGRPMDRLRFVTAGALPPLTPDADWEVTLSPTPAGLALTARPLGVAAPPRMVLGRPDVRGLDVRVLTWGGRQEWTDRWRFPTLVPEAIELTYWGEDRPLEGVAPLRLALPHGGVR